MRLIAENRLNAGRADQAARLYRCADQIDHQASANGALQPRVLLRLGRLNQARAALEQQTSDDLHAMPQRRPAGHREATVMLSLVHALQGNEAEALRYAQQGLDLGRELGSGLLEAIAHIRLGHASQLGAAPDVVAANQHYLQAMALADAFGVRRTKVEAYLGLVLLHGFGGDLLAAQAAAHEGLALAERSGDRWSVALLWTALGAVCVMHRGADAEMWLSQALRQYEECKDTYGQTVVHLWLAIWHQRAGNEEAAAYTRRTLALAGQHGYGGLLTRATLFGPRDRMLLVPILLAGRADPQLSRQAQSWLQEGFPAIAADEEIQTYHPGSTLRIQTFGALRIWRGTDEVTQREWTRKKAPALLALLLTNRHRWLLRDQICDWLWPELSPSEADLQFKVTLNALNAALEPARPPRTAPFYIRRRGSAYRFLPLDGIWLDVDEFDARIATARAHIAAGTDDDLQAALTALSVAVGLYSGDYLSEYLYEEWVQAERERWATRFLQAATMLAELLLRRGRSAEAISICDMVLMRDPCWEEAYRVLMRAYAEQGNRPQALAIYERCARHLRTQLDVAPDAETTALYRQLKA